MSVRTVLSHSLPRLIACFCIYLLAGIAGLAGTATHGQAVLPEKMLPDMRQITSQIFFEPTDRQIDGEQVYMGRAAGYSVFLSKNEISFTVTTSHDSTNKHPDAYRTVRLAFTADPHASIVGIEELEGKSNYFSGSNPQMWRRNVPHFAKVLYNNIYPGIDLVFYSRNGQMEFDYLVRPGANPDLIHLKTIGGETSLSPVGDLVVRADKRDLITIKKPAAFQKATQQTVVPVRFERNRSEFGLRVAQYNRSQQLVIDPALIFSTYLTTDCANCDVSVNGMAADASGVYLVGSTNATPFPSVSGGPQATETGEQAFIMKLGPTGSNIIYEDFFSGSGRVPGAQAYSVAVDSVGAAYVVGVVAFPAPAFPTTTGVFSTSQPSAPCPAVMAQVYDCGLPFAMKVSPDGTTIQYSTFLQTPYPSGNTNTATDIIHPLSSAVDSTGALYISGTAGANGCSSDFPSGSLMPLPVTVGAFQTVQPARCTAFAMKLNPTASAFDYATYLGPIYEFNGMSVDTNGAAYVTGMAPAGYPTTTGAYQTSIAGSDTYNVFVSKLSGDGTSLAYSTFFGAFDINIVSNETIAVDPLGQAIIVGSANQPPTTPGALCGDPVPPPAITSAFVTKFNSSGSGLVYSTTLCAAAAANGVSVDSTGAAYVTGSTSAPALFPLMLPIQQYQPGSTIVAKLDTSGNLDWSTFFGAATGLQTAVDPVGSTYVLGQGRGIPVTPGALEPLTSPGVSDQNVYFIAKIAPSLGAPVPIILFPASLSSISTTLSFGDDLVGVPSTAQSVSLGNFGDAALPPPTISITGDFTQTNTCASPVPGGQKCDISISFDPTATGNRTGTLTISFGGTFATQTVSLTGTGTAPQVSLPSNSLVFPPQSVGTSSAAMQITISNPGSGALTIASLPITGDFTQTNACGAPIAPNGTCTVQVTFMPTAQGFRTGSLSINDNASGSPQMVSLQGYGGSATTGTLSPASVTFGSQAVGVTSAAQAVTLSNSGTIALAIASISATGDFAQSNTCGSSVAAGGSCQISITFTPTASGTRTGALRIVDNTAQSPQSVALSGTGTGPNLGLGLPAGGSGSLTLAAGANGSYTLTIGGAGVAGTASLSCTGAPTGATCSVPATVSLNANTPSSITVSVTTTSRSALLMPIERTPGLPILGIVLGIGMIAAPMALAKRWKTRIGFASLVMALGLCACGGGGPSSGGSSNPNGTPAGNYQLIVTASSGSTTQTTNLTLTVQ